MFHPVLHLSDIPNRNNRNSVELFKANKFGKSYTLHQALYQELNVIELPVVTKKRTKNSITTDLTSSNRTNHTLNEPVKEPAESLVDKNSPNPELTTKDEDYLKLSDCSYADFSLTDDSGCVSLNSTATNDDYSSEETTANKHALRNSMESLSSSYDSNDSMLNSIQNSIQSEQLKKEDELVERVVGNDRSSGTIEESRKTVQINKSNLVNNLVIGNLIRRSLASELIATSLMSGLNDGHVIIGFRMKDEFFRKCFESNWLEMSGVRLLYPVSASRFGLRRIKFWKRIGLNTERAGGSFDDGTTFNYILYAEFLNLTAKNEIYLSNFVHRLRLRSLGAITLYTNLN